MSFSAYAACRHFFKDLKMNEYQRFTSDISLILLIAQWGCFRIPLAAALLAPQEGGGVSVMPSYVTFHELR
jgi:hypothetical protein